MRNANVCQYYCHPRFLTLLYLYWRGLLPREAFEILDVTDATGEGGTAMLSSRQGSFRSQLDIGNFADLRLDGDDNTPVSLTGSTGSLESHI